MYEEVKINSKKWLDIKNLKNEIWKDIPGYEGLYQISNYGRLKSLERYVNSGIKNNSKVKRKEQICTAKINKLGYIHYTLSKNCKPYNINAHYLIAQLFLNKENFKYMDYEDTFNIDFNKLEVNHKDENPNNCRIDNLEWCTRAYNINYGTRNKKTSQIMLKRKTGIPVEQYNKNNVFLKKYDSIKLAAKENNISRSQIARCCKRIYKQGGGYIWKYANNKDLF